MDGTGTVAAEDRLKAQPPEAQSENATADVVDATPFNENLFLDEDLDGLDQELNDLDLDDSSEEKS